MSNTATTEATVIPVDDSAAAAPNDAARSKPTAKLLPGSSSTPAAAKRTAPRITKMVIMKSREAGVWMRGAALVDFAVRICALAATLTAAIFMGTTNETLPFFTEYYQFHANFSDLPALMFFVVGNAVAAGYLIISLPFSLCGICRPTAARHRLLLLLLDNVMVALTAAAGSAAAAIVYLAHNGDSKANWVPICLRFDGFCQRISGAVVASFIAVVFFIFLVSVSAVLLRNRNVSS